MAFPRYDVREALPNYPGRPLWFKRPATGVTELLVHHTAGPSWHTPWDVNRVHWNRNFSTTGGQHYAPRITYHFLIGVDGTQWKCNAVSDVTWHCPGHNRTGLSVCLLGNRDTSVIPASQYGSLVSLARELCYTLRVTPSHVWRHRDFFPTACPGQYFDITKFRKDLR